MKKAIMQMAMAIAKKRKMAMGGEVDDEDETYDTPMGLQESGEYHPEIMGGSEELARALADLGGQMAMGGLVGDEVAPQSSDATPTEPKIEPTETPESLLGSSDLTDGAKKAIADKKKRRRFKQ